MSPADAARVVIRFICFIRSICDQRTDHLIGTSISSFAPRLARSLT